MRGDLFKELGKYQEAIDDYTRAIELDLPRVNTSAYLARGVAQHNFSDSLLEEAINDYTQAMENELWLIEPSYFRGIAYEELGRYRDAIQDYNRVIELSREHSEGRFYIDNTYARRGVVFHKLNMPTEAFDDFRHAARLGNKSAQTHLQERGLNW